MNTLERTKKKNQEFIDFYFQLSSQPNMIYNVYMLIVLYIIWSNRVTNNRLIQAVLTLAIPYPYGFFAIVLGEG